MNEMMLLAASSGQQQGGGGGSDVDPDFKFNVFLSAIIGENGQNNYSSVKQEMSAFDLTPSSNGIAVAKGRHGPLANVGWWVLFPGASPRSSISYEASTNYWVFPADFKITLEFIWMPGGDSQQCLIGTGHSTATPWEILIHNTGGLTFLYGSTWNYSNVYPDQFVRNYLEVNRVGNTVRMFLNGQQIHSFTLSAQLGDAVTARIMRIGNANNTARSFRGLIRNVHVEKGIGGNTSNYTPPTSDAVETAYTQCLTAQTPYLSTIGPAPFLLIGAVLGFTGTIRMFPDVFKRKNNLAYNANTQGGSIVCNDGFVSGIASVDVGSGDYTIDGFVNMHTTGNGGSVFSSHGTTVSTGTSISWVNSTHALDSRTGRNASGQFTNVSFGLNLPQGQWVYLKTCKSGTTLRVWYNGTYRAQVSTSRLAEGNNYRIGHLYGSDVTNAELHARAWIAMSRFTANAENTNNNNIPIPTSLPSVNGFTKMLMTNKDQAAVVDYCQATNIRMSAGASVSDAVTFLGLNSVFLNGSTGFLTSGDVSPFYYLPNNEDWEIEGNFQASSNANEKRILTIGNVFATVSCNLCLNLLTNNLLNLILSNGSAVVSYNSSTTAPNNQKHCVAICWTASTKTVDVYLNGTRVISQNNVTGYVPPEHLPRIYIGIRGDGVESVNSFHGYMGPWRIRRGKRTITGATYAVPTTMYPAR